MAIKNKKGKEPVKNTGKYISDRQFGETKADADRRRKLAEDERDRRFDFLTHESSIPRLGWLVNIQPATLEDSETGIQYSGLDFYFIDDGGATFKASMDYRPYFFVLVKNELEKEVDSSLRKKFPDMFDDITVVEKEDLDMNNHLAGNLRTCLKLSFRTVADLMEVKRHLFPIVTRNKERFSRMAEVELDDQDKAPASVEDFLSHLCDIREYDVTYYERVCIDLGIRVGLWYDVVYSEGTTTLKNRPDLVRRAEPPILAFDIETTKQPLKFPDRDTDCIFMISYMLDGEGFLIINREVVSEDIEDFEYSPRPEFEGRFTVFNEENERNLIEQFFRHIQQVKPLVYVTYNGDFFDWPFLEHRANVHGINMLDEIGVGAKGDEYYGRFAVHMDCFYWVKRDSYLPQGSQGLKAVAKAKLGYNPIEIDPEDMVRFAHERPQHMASYSVSDAVATYYLFMKYVNPFIFSLCNIIPMVPDDVLRRGSGTLCEMLLMVQAYEGNILCPNKQQDGGDKFYRDHRGNHLIESETYVGGHVEALQAGVFRADFDYKFSLVPSAFQFLIDNIDKALRFSIEKEGKHNFDDVTNYEEVRAEIVKELEALRDRPNRIEQPSIYHLDVSAMYPNIILSNRLQPMAIVDQSTCAACDHNKPGAECQRKMNWVWRGEYYAADYGEYQGVKRQVEYELATKSKQDQSALIKKRLREFCQRVYKRVIDKKQEQRESTICMKENPFYVNTVRNFRDRRYEYKALLKKAKGSLDKAQTLIETKEAKQLVVLYDSLQLAHKCILNSFYGYVMRRGARWYSIEMAGVVTHTGGNIIKQARELVEQIGIPLELDTDGIWCILPKSFPEDFTFKLKSGKKYEISYPCVMLNADVDENFTNHQYHNLVDPKTQEYKVHSECSILFEVDGPYKAMILPASTEEGKLLKKRYAVFNFDGSLAELKGFELKRRGELKLIKIFQEQVFDYFLKGSTLEECYAAVSRVANQWLDVLDSRGQDIDDDELLELIGENRTLSGRAEDYGSQKSTSLTTARRLAEFLGDEMIKDSGLACKFIISEKPIGAPVSERAVPIAIFSTDDSIKRQYIRTWLKDNSLTDFDMRSILDWTYYRDRLGSCIQKIISIPAAMQMVSNPVPRVPFPDWLTKAVRTRDDKMQQRKISRMFQITEKPAVEQPQEPFLHTSKPALMDIEGPSTKGRGGKPVVTIRQKRPVQAEEADDTPCPEQSEDFKGWLMHHKKKWRRDLAEIKRQRKEGGDLRIQRGPGSRAGTVNSFFQSTTQAIQRQKWQIVQIRESSEPGVMDTFVVINHSIVKLRVVTPRRFYINYRTPPSQAEISEGFHAVPAKILPRGKQALHLYEVVMSESAFRESERDILDSLSGDDVEGIYGLHTPLLFRTIMKLGCVAKLGRRTNDTNNVYNLEDLDYVPTAEHPYLTDENLRYVFVYGNVTRNRGCFALFNSDNKVVKIIIVKPDGMDLESGLMRSLKSSMEEGDGFEFEIDSVATRAEAEKAIDTFLDQFTRGNPAIILAQMTGNPRGFTKAMPTLNELPYYLVPTDPEDEVHKPFGWQVRAVSFCVERFKVATDTMADLISISQYSHIPLCNIETSNWKTQTTDYMYARMLVEKNHVLWASEGKVADVNEEDEELGFAFDQQVNPVVKYPGAYRTSSLFFSIQLLAPNALIATDNQLGEPESEELRLFVESSDVSRALDTLRNLVSWLHEDSTEGESNFSLQLCQNFYLWARSPSSVMFDPSIKRVIHDLMRKVFAYMLGEISKLGLKVVYADFSRVYLNTQKYTPQEAILSCQMALQTVKGRHMFRMLEWDPLECNDETIRVYRSLLFMDAFNLCYIYEDVAHDDAMNDGESEQNLASSWNIAKYLPVNVQDRFLLDAANFLKGPHDKIAEVLETNPLAGAKFLKATEENAVRSVLQNVIKPQMLDNVAILNESRHDPDVDNVFPQLSGSFLNLRNVPLEYVKFVCMILSLDGIVGNEVTLLRRQLLRLVNIREFDPDAQFQNPCMSFTLPDVICKRCGYCRDIDLCRDEDGLVCTLCETPYTKSDVENELVDIVQRLQVSYQLQDLVCVKCHGVKTESYNTYCKCSGRYANREDATKLHKRFNVLSSVSQFHSFKYLGDILSSLQNDADSDSLVQIA